jgi:hypothetical protein
VLDREREIAKEALAAGDKVSRIGSTDADMDMNTNNSTATY